MDTPINFGCGVSLLVNSDDVVYLASPGFADPRVVMRRRERNTPMIQFDRCVFTFETPPTQKRSVASDVRGHMMYGKSVCLVHEYSGLYVTIVKKPADCNPGHFKILLMTQEDAGSACKLRIMPRYKIRSEGDRVYDGDMIYLQQENSQISLCASPESATEESEVTAWEMPSTLQVSLYDERSDANEEERHPSLRAGMASIIFHREADAILTIPTVPLPGPAPTKPQSKRSASPARGDDASSPPPETAASTPLSIECVPYFKHCDKVVTDLSAECLDFSSNSMWIIENIDTTVGGMIRVRDPFRIRHGATGKYLMALKTSNAAPPLSHKSPDKNGGPPLPDLVLEDMSVVDGVESSVWEIELVSATDATMRIYASKSFVQVRHRLSKGFISICRTSTESRSSAVALSREAHLEDTLTMVLVPRDRQQELSYLIGNVEFLKRYIKFFYEMQDPKCHLSPRDPIVTRVVQRATSSLGALIRFCTDSDDSDPLTREGLPIPHHQQSMFEVQLHTTAMDVLLCPFVNAKSENKMALPLVGGVMAMDDILEPMYDNIHTVCRLCYRLLKQMSKRSPFAGLLVDYVAFMQAQEGYKLHVADTQMEIFTNNPHIPQSVCDDNIKHFVKLLLKKGRSSGYLRFLSSLCVVHDVGISENQKHVADLVLRKNKGKILFPTSMRNGTLCIQAPKAASKKKTASVEESEEQAVVWEELGNFLTNGDSKGVKFFESSIDLLGVICLGGNEECLALVRAEIPMEHLAFAIDPTFLSVSDSLRSSYIYLALHLYIREILDRLIRPASMSRYSCGQLVNTTPADLSSADKSVPSIVPPGGEAFLNTIKARAMHFLLTPKGVQNTTLGVNDLLLTASSVWQTIVTYDHYRAEELTEVVHAVIEALDYGNDTRSGDERYVMTEETATTMRTKRGLCYFLCIVLKHEVSRISDKLLHDLVTNGEQSALKMADDLITDLRQKVFHEARLLPMLLDLMFYENKDLVSTAVQLALALCNSGGAIAKKVSVAEPVVGPIGGKCFQLFVKLTADLTKSLSPSGNVINEADLIHSLRNISTFDPTHRSTDYRLEPVQVKTRSASIIGKLHSKVGNLISMNRNLGAVREQRGQWRKAEENMIEYSRILFRSEVHHDLFRAFQTTESPSLHLALLEFFRVLSYSADCVSDLSEQIPNFVPFLSDEETRSDSAAIMLRLVQHNPRLAEHLDEAVVANFVALLLTVQEPVIGEGLEHVVLGTFPVPRHQSLVLNNLLTTDVLNNLFAANSNWPAHQLAFNSACVDLMACCCVSNSTCKATLQKHIKSNDILRIISISSLQSVHLIPYFKLLSAGFLTIEEFLTAQELQTIKKQWSENAAWWQLLEGPIALQLVADPKSIDQDLVYHGILPVIGAFYMNLFILPNGKYKLDVSVGSMAKILSSFCHGQLTHNTEMSEYMALTLVQTLTAVAAHTMPASDNHTELTECIASAQKIHQRVHEEEKIDEKRERLKGVEHFEERWGENTATSLAPIMALFSYNSKMHVAAATNPKARRLHEKLVTHIQERELSEDVAVGLLATFRHSILQYEGKEDSTDFTETQNYLNSIGALRMVTEIAISSSMACGAETLRFAVSVLEGGNKTVQDSILDFFSNTDERFFHEISWLIRTCTEAAMQHRARGAHATFYSGVKEAAISFGNVGLVLRFLQLLCEGHHLGLQDYLREQRDNLRSVNVVKEVMRFAAEITLHDLDHESMGLMEQTLAVLCELCQGPCQGNQKLLVSNGGCHVVNVIMTSPLFATQPPYDSEELQPLLLVKLRAMTFLNALLEGSMDKDVVTIVVQDMRIKSLGVVLNEFAGSSEFQHESNDAVCEIVFSSLIAIKTLMNNHVFEGPEKEDLDEILVTHKDRFASLGQIEIERHDNIEQVYFRVPKICFILSEDSKETLKWSLDRSTQGSKLSDFLDKCDELIFDMEATHRVTSQMQDNKVFMILAKKSVRVWDDWSLLVAITMNMLFVAVIEDCRGLLDHETEWIGIEGVIRLLAYAQLLFTSVIVFMDSSMNFPLLLYKQSKTIKNPSMTQKITAIMQRNETLYRFVAVMFAFLGLFFYDFFFAFHLLGLIARSSELKNVIVAVTQNGKTLLLTGMLGCVVVYLFSIIGFVVFHDHFDNSCDTLSQCVLHILTTGLRQGGGIGDQMTTLKFGEPMYYARTLYDFFFWAIMIVIFLNILFGIIIDTFAELRDDKNKRDEDMRTQCTICGIDSYTFDRYGSGFRTHTKDEHNMWTYLYFLHHLKKKEPTEYNGQESYVAECVASGDISFFPANKCSSLKNLPAGTTEKEDGAEEGKEGDGPRRAKDDGSHPTGAVTTVGAPSTNPYGGEVAPIGASASQDQTMNVLFRILAKIDAAEPSNAGKLSPQPSMRMLPRSTDPQDKSLEAARVEASVHLAQRQHDMKISELQRTYLAELERLTSHVQAQLNRTVSFINDLTERFMLHFQFIETLEVLYNHSKVELFVNTITSLMLRMHQANSSLKTKTEELARKVDALSDARGGTNSSVPDDPLMKDGHEVMKLLRLTIREARAAISNDSDKSPQREKSMSQGSH